MRLALFCALGDRRSKAPLAIDFPRAAAAAAVEAKLPGPRRYCTTRCYIYSGTDAINDDGPVQPWPGEECG